MSQPEWPPALVAKVTACALAGHKNHAGVPSHWHICVDGGCNFAARFSDDAAWDTDAVWLDWRDPSTESNGRGWYDHKGDGA